MSLLLARRDFARFSGAGFSVELTFKPDTSAAGTVVNGLATKHHLGIDTEGLVVNTKNTHCTVAESALVALGYTVRNAANEVDMVGHLVTYTDSAGIDAQYQITECLPDETIGHIQFFLGDFE